MSSQTRHDTEEERPAVTPHPDRSRRGTDTSRWRRIASAVIGGLLVLRGLRRRSFGSLIGAVAGGWLLYRGLGQPDVRSKVESVRSEAGRVTEAQTQARSQGESQSQTGAPAESLAVERSITIEESPDELYDRWREPETHERLWADFAEVTQTEEDQQHWAVGGPMDVTIEWDAEVTDEEPGEFLRWESLPGATVPNEGSVRFRPRENRDGTEVTLRVRFDPPGGSFTTTAAEKVDIVPDTVAGQVLQRFKALVETGEIPTLEDNPSGRGRGDVA